jgi:hypothetical protein
VSAMCLPGGQADVMGVTKRRIAGVGGTEGQRCQVSLTPAEPSRYQSCSVDGYRLDLRGPHRGAERWRATGCHMNEDVIIPWLLYRPPIWTVLLAALAPAAIAHFKQRSTQRWYFYGFVCALVAWPLIVLATIHAFLVRSRAVAVSPEVRQRERRADSLALLAESSVPSYPSWIAELRLKSPEGVDRRRYAYEKIGPGESIELVRERANQHNGRAVAFRHHGVHLGYVPKRDRWVAPAIDDGRRLVAIVDKVKVGGVMRRRAKFVGVRIAVLDAR